MRNSVSGALKITRVLTLAAATLFASVALAGGEETAGGLPPIDGTTSLLVVSPHPDDETLCCAGVIRRVVAAGGHVSVVWITSGDGSELSMLLVEKSLFRPLNKVRDLARKRMMEARAATTLLGVDPTAQFFLGYPDGGIRKLLTDNRSTVYRGYARPLPRRAFPRPPLHGREPRARFHSGARSRPADADSGTESAGHASRPRSERTAHDPRAGASR
jgi:LmbE family N-acetylglucosaminyl deacetylase